jgi:cytochrome c-type protein NapB
MKRYGVLILLLAVSGVVSAQNIATLRGGALDREAQPPVMSRVDNSAAKRQRAYPMQPPVTPHKTDNYQVDLNANKCMACHSRRRTGETRATMVSVTHYMDREGNFLAEVSPRRYFCKQCHVKQHEVQPLVGNNFVDIDVLLGANGTRQDAR